MIKYLGFDFFFDTDTIRLLIFSALLGNIFRLLLSAIHNQTWTRSRLQFLTFSFLPAITFIITKTIAGNIALSLGMVGALSIVRLRTPVKNPFELVVYFLLITIGIAMAVKLKYGILLTVFFILTVISINFIEKYFKKKGLSIFSISFREGNLNNLIEINTNGEIIELENSSYLIQILKEKNDINYRLVSNNKNEIEELYKKYKSHDLVKNLNVEYN